MLYGFVPFNLEVNQAFIAAILTIIGYAINDTVVVFDRIPLQEGLSCLMAKATPEIRPPPPMGTTACSTSGSCSRISRPCLLYTS